MLTNLLMLVKAAKDNSIVRSVPIFVYRSLYQSSPFSLAIRHLQPSFLPHIKYGFWRMLP